MLTTPSPSGSGHHRGLHVDHQRDLEKMFQIVRPLIALAALVAEATPTFAASQKVGPAAILLAVYAVFGAALIVTTRLRRGAWHVPAPTIHVVDLGVALVATAAARTNGPFFLLFLYTLLAAGLRWGFFATVLTATTAVLLLALGALVVPTAFSASLAPHDGFGDQLFARAVFLLAAGCLIGYLAQRERRLRIEASEIAAMTACADVRQGLKRTIARVFELLLRCFGARRVLLIACHRSSETLYAWEAAVSADGTMQELRSTPLDPGDLAVYMTEPSATAWHAVRRRGLRGTRLDVVAIDSNGKHLDTRPWRITEALFAAIEPFQGVLAVGLNYPGQEWTGRLFFIDPRVGWDRRGILGLAMRVVRHVGPAVQNVQLLRSVRSTAVAAERGRIAREMHDGVIQGVLGVEIHVAALSRRVADEAPGVVRELGRLSRMLRQEVIKLRELMQEMHPLEVNGDQLIDVLADFVQRFQRETGITARFITQLDRVALTPRACREVARILSEALINVRRHSGARHVFVRLSTVNGACLLSIEDDGRGFAFSGMRSHRELDGSRLGPLVIKERVRQLGGQLTLESDPGRGARLEIGVPLSGHVTHA